MRTTHFNGVIAILAMATATGCISRDRAGRPAAPSVQAITTARITNNHWLNIRVYGVRSGSRDVIGVVTSFSTETFELPRYLVATHALQIYVDPIGSRQSYQTDLITVGPGQRIDLVVQEHLQHSHYSVVDP